jgi:DNA-binding transcriptional regulator YdaS (Cro superfamily)
MTLAVGSSGLSRNLEGREELAAFRAMARDRAGSGRLTPNANFFQTAAKQTYRQVWVMASVRQNCSVQAGVRLRERRRSAVLQKGKRALAFRSALEI